MAKELKELTSRKENYAQWYQDLVIKAGLAENAAVRGCMEKVKLFSLTALICIFVFYCIPSGKSASNLLPAYPFIAVFLAQFFLYLTEYRTKVTRVFSTVLFILVCLAIAAAVFLLT